MARIRRGVARDDEAGDDSDRCGQVTNRGLFQGVILQPEIGNLEGVL